MSEPIGIKAVACDASLSPHRAPFEEISPGLVNNAATNVSDTSASMQTSTPTAAAGSVDNMIPVLQTLFQVSEQHFSEAFNASHRRSYPNAAGITRNDCSYSRKDYVAIGSTSVSACLPGVEQKNFDEKPVVSELAPILMMTYLSNCMNNIKSTLNTNGLPVGIDANGRAVDYSCRPIDPIFQQARARMENAREFREITPLGTVAQATCAPGADDGEIVSAMTATSPVLSLTAVRSQASHPRRIDKTNTEDILIRKCDEAIEEVPGSSSQKRIRVASGVELL